MYDGDAQNYLLEDKLEMKVVRHYLWTHGKYTIESVCIGSVRFHTFYMGSVQIRTVKLLHLYRIRTVNYVHLYRIRMNTVISLYGIRILPYVRI